MVHDGIFLGFLTIFCISGVFLNAMLAQKGAFQFHHNTVTTIKKIYK